MSDKRGAEYLIRIKDILVLASAPYTPNESFFHEGQRHNIWHMPLPDYIHNGVYDHSCTVIQYKQNLKKRYIVENVTEDTNFDL